MPNLIMDLHKLKPSFCSSHKGQFQIVERLLWVPADAFDFVGQVREKYDSAFSEQCVEELLLGLNNIWMQREQNQISRLRKKYEGEIHHLKRLLN